MSSAAYVLIIDSLCCIDAAVQPAPPSKPASMTGSIETAASLGSGVTAQLAGQGSIGGQAEAAIGVANRALDEVLRQLQEKYTLWQQRLDAHVDQVGALPLCGLRLWAVCLAWCHASCWPSVVCLGQIALPLSGRICALHFSGSIMRE